MSKELSIPRSPTPTLSPPPQSRQRSPSPNLSSIRRPSPDQAKQMDVLMKVASLHKDDKEGIIVNMVPESFDHINNMDENEIIYPKGVTDKRPYDIVAGYRKAKNKSLDFEKFPLLVGADSDETVVLGVASFAEQHGCLLTFTDQIKTFDDSIYQAAAGVIDIGSFHLLANDILKTANFLLEMDLKDQPKMFESNDKIKKFVEDFCGAIVNLLSCPNGTIRLFSIKPPSVAVSGLNEVHIGLTTPEPKQTEQLAHDFEMKLFNGIPGDPLLCRIKRQKYKCYWKPVLNYLQIRPSDLDPRFNFDYRRSNLPTVDSRGSYPYYLPIGWYRHALRVLGKYTKDESWIGHINGEGEWPVAFHGTHSDAAKSIVEYGLALGMIQRDAMKNEAIDQIGEQADRPGLYVATHCEGGSYPQYTTKFEVPFVPGETEEYSLVFQCRVQPGKFTTHSGPVSVGEAWRVIDPSAVRPYGILLKLESSKENLELGSTDDEEETST